MALYYSDKIAHYYDPIVTKSSSRYTTKRRLVDNTKKTFIRFIRNRDINFDNSGSTVHVVTPVEAFRPDLIAYKYFGSEKYAWVILAANNLSLAYELESGMKILIPNIASLQGANGKLVTR